MDLVEVGAKVGLYFIPFLFALCFHEYAHGLIAKMRGDNTAQMMGRLTMNPLPHLDLIGTVILPLSAIIFATPIFFGWAKPVPVNPRNFKNMRSDMFWVALAGPLSNIFLALVGAGAMALVAHFANQISFGTAKAIVNILNIFISINLFLAVFNLIPLHPLDGGKVLARFLPAHLNYKLERNEHVTSLILLALVLTGALQILAIPVSWGHDVLVQWALGGL